MAHRIWHWGDDPTPLVETLSRGGILAIPTESSYGLAVDPQSQKGVEAIFRLKDRASTKALPIVAASLEQILALGVHRTAPGLGQALRVWPAPLSVVLPLDRPLAAALHRGSLAVRIPSHAKLRDILDHLGTAVTATSANLSGHPPLVDPRSVASLLAAADAWVLDDGLLPGGEPSTLVRWEEDGFVVLRAGRYPTKRLAEATPRNRRRRDA